MDDQPFRPPATAKEVVIYRGGWGFRLPDQHEVQLNEERSLARISLPDRGGTYAVRGVEETEDEFRIHVTGEALMGHALRDLPAEYDFPSIDVELERLTREYNALRRLPPDTPVGWAQGASHDSHTSWLRSEIRTRASA